MKNLLLIFLLLLPPLVVLSQQSIPSARYSWKKPAQKTAKDILSTTLFEGSAYDMEYLQMSANTLLPSKKKISMQVAANEEQLMIIKTGTVSITIQDSTWTIGSGSIALLMPGEEYSLQNTAKDSCHYYTMKYRSKLPVDAARGKTAGGSLIKDWNKIEFKPGGKGGSRKFFERPTAMCKRFEMHVTTLNEGLKSHEPHTHRAEEIVLVKESKTEMQIADKFYKGNVGDVYYLGSSVLHAIRNDGAGPCVYFAFQFE
jgi:(S)-ureidoglycine aminohydrolase